MEYREYPPTAGVRHLVRCYWTLSADESAPSWDPEPALPDGSPELIITLADPFVALTPSGERITQPSVMLVGQITGPLTVGPSGRVNLVAVRFQSAGAALVCDNLGALTDTWTDVSALAVPELTDLHAALSRAAGADERIRVLDELLARVMMRRSGPDADVTAAVRAIDESHGMVALESLAATLGCSMRHLQRRFALQVGVSPKMLARIRRFQRVFQAWRDDARSLSRVALECGYFDQPHLIRDFRDFAGSAPAAFLANQPEFTQLFLPSKRQRQ